MIGYDSLIWSACSLWQKLTIGLSAEWVEEVEKDGDSDWYREVVLSRHTKLKDRKMYYASHASDFGLELGGDKVRQEADEDCGFKKRNTL